MLVAIHQPNYLPWLGYFHKIARADKFVFLDRAQFAKGSYTNRVQIIRDGGARWLTQPIRHRFGQPIADVKFADLAWPSKHLDALRGAYRNAAAFTDVWPDFEDLYTSIPVTGLAAANCHIVKAIAQRLGITTTFETESVLDIDQSGADDRLIALVGASASDASYLSGAGGRKYQDPAKFEAAGIPLVYTDYDHPVYDQGSNPFVPGVSIADALFNLGWASTGALLAVSG
jgi:hypothetical protein